MAALSGYEYQLKTPFDSTISTQDNRPTNDQFDLVVGLRTASLNLASSVIDSTSASSSEYREILDGHGIVMADLSGSGVLNDDRLHQALEANTTSSDLRWFQIQRGDGTRFSFKGKVVSFNSEASHDDVVSFTLEVQSSGGITREDNSGNVFNSTARRITSFSNALVSVNVRTFVSEAYEYSNIPVPLQRAESIRTYLATQTAALANLTITSATPIHNLTIQAGTTASRFYFPVVLFAKSQITGKTIQAVDSFNTNLKLEPLEDYTLSGIVYSAYFINKILATGEEVVFNVEVG